MFSKITRIIAFIAIVLTMQSCSKSSDISTPIQAPNYSRVSLDTFYITSLSDIPSTTPFNMFIKVLQHGVVTPICNTSSYPFIGIQLNSITNYTYSIVGGSPFCTFQDITSSASYQIQFWQTDGTNLGTVNFVPFNHISTYPTQLNLTGTGVSIKMNLKWLL